MSLSSRNAKYTERHTAKEWTALGSVLLAVGIAIAVIVSLVGGIIMAVAGLAIILQMQLGFGPKPKPERERRA